MAKMNLDNAPQHIKAIALAAWAEWLLCTDHPKRFTVSVTVNGSRARVTSFARQTHATADGSTCEVEITETPQ